MKFEIPPTTTLSIKGRSEFTCANPKCGKTVKPQNAEAARLAQRHGGFKCRACRARVGAQWTKQTYAEYLMTDHWQRCRRRALMLAAKACILCKSTESLQVHHNNYDNLGGELDSDLAVLCGYHHKKLHEDEENVL